MRPRPIALGTVALLVGLFAPATGRGQFTRIADTSTAVPGGSGNFLSFDQFPSVAGGGVAFKGLDAANRPGIYTGGGGTPTVIANTSTSIPSGPGLFVTLGSPAVSGSNVVFPGSPGGGPTATPYFGVYANTGSGGALV